MGSPKYMSPEQMLSMRDVDGRSDIWSLGAILYELLTGTPPFLADTTPRICALVLNTDPKPPSALRLEIPAELERVVLRCLEKEPGRRYATVAELVEALTAPAAPVPSVAPTPAVPVADAGVEAAPAKPARGRHVAFALLGLAVLAGTVALVVTQRGHDGVVAGGTTAATAAGEASASSSARMAPSSAPTAEPKAYSVSDLPDVRPAVVPRPGGSGSAAVGARPKPTAADPFGGRRN